ncbi:MAG: membrane protein [Phycisphaerae bacterium]
MTTSTRLSAPPDRLVSLDVFRGLTVAGMILVNNAGDDGAAYAPLKHAAWNGWTPTDLVFPSFLFIVGTSLVLSFTRRLDRGESRGLLLAHALRRSVVLFVLGVLLNSFGFARVFDPSAARWPVLIPTALVVAGLGFIWPDEGAIARKGWGRSSPRVILALLAVAGAAWAFVHHRGLFAQSSLRLPGVLQRIALCYLLASVVVLYAGAGGRLLMLLACLVGYWAIMRFVPAPAGFSAPVAAPEGLLHDWIDQWVFRGAGHLYRERPDPEGLLSTLPALATTLMGALAGGWLLGARGPERKAAGLMLAGLLALAAGLLLDHWVPINKKIWTSSYVLLAGGFGLYILGACFLLVDLEGLRRWAVPFLVLGTNAIAAYVLSGGVGSLLEAAWPTADGGAFVPKDWFYARLTIADPALKSLIYSLAYVALWMVLFYPLYRLRVFIRI